MPDRVLGQVVVLAPETGPVLQQRDLLGLFGPHARLQDVGEQVVVAAPLPPIVEGDDEQVLAPPQRQRGELERGDPPLRPLHQGGGVLRGEAQSRHLVEVRRDLVVGEAQIGAADLDQLAARAHPGQRERRVGAAGDHQVQPRGEVLQQERQPVVYVARIDDVVVVEHQHDVVHEGAQGVEQLGEDRLDRWSGRPQERQRLRAEPARRSGGPLQRGDQVRPEQRGIVVPPVEREPRR